MAGAAAERGVTPEREKPVRYRRALYHTVPDAMPEGFCQGMYEWLGNNRRLLQAGGDGQGRFNFEILELDQYCDRLAPFRGMLTEQLPDALEPCEVEPFDLGHIEIHACLYFHGSFFHWHDDAYGPDGQGNIEPVTTRRLTFAYYMRQERPEPLFQGGQLEFGDGTLVEPANNRLVMFHPLQDHRIRPVECYSADPMWGRWSLMGWFHARD